MSIDFSRTYIVPIERAADAFAAAAEIAIRPEPYDCRIVLPDGSLVVFPLAPVDREPLNALSAERSVSFDFAFGADGDDITDYLRRDAEPPFLVERLNSEGTRALVRLRLFVSADPLYIAFTFHNTCNKDCDLLGLRSVCDALDYVGRCAESLVTYETVMGEDRLIEPFNGVLPPSDGPDGGMRLARVVEYVWTRGAV